MTMSITEKTLRLMILIDARDGYVAACKLAHVTDAERSIYNLKIAECAAMLRDLEG